MFNRIKCMHTKVYTKMFTLPVLKLERIQKSTSCKNRHTEECPVSSKKSFLARCGSNPTPLIPALGAEAGASLVNLRLAWCTGLQNEIYFYKFVSQCQRKKAAGKKPHCTKFETGKVTLKRSFCCLWSHDWGDNTEALKGAENVMYLKPGNDYMVRIFILKNSTNRAGNGRAKALPQPLGDPHALANTSKTISSLNGSQVY